ncbi:hypothetical protein BsWGS_19477 [Bradybaena similaris]
MGVRRQTITYQDDHNEKEDEASHEAQELLFGIFDENRLSVKQERAAKGVGLFHDRLHSKDSVRSGRFSFTRRDNRYSDSDDGT